MSKSKYPKKIDSSVELPIVRDNIIQIGSEAINSLRSAIINIEKTLGVMPNGYDAGTVADRLNKSLDELGNLKASAVSALNLLSGPIKNKDVQENARIEESKLDLDFSTNALYAQSESLRKDLENIIGTVNELSLLLSIHLNPDASGSHKAKNISVEEIQENGSDTTDLSKGVQNLQLILDELINKHINYSGSGISEDNNSHEANQIFYDNVNTSLESSSVQGAIDEISNLNFNIGDQLKDDFFSNGYLKTVSKNTGKAISEPLDITYYVYSGISDSAISTINYSGVINETPETFDIIRIGESDYQIHSIDTVLKTIKVYGIFSSDSGSGVQGVIYRNEHKKSNPAAFKMMPVFNSDGLETKAIKFVNPDSTYVISDVLALGGITTGSNLKVKIDSLLEHTFTFSSTDSEINNLIDTISKDISVNNLPISAFRVETEEGTRLGLALDLVNSSDKIYYINLSGSTANLSFLGFDSINGIDVYGSFGSSFLINGLQYSSLNKKFSSTGLNIINSSEVIQASASGINFIERKVKENDILVITGSSASDGAYLINSVTETELEVDSSVLLASNTNETAVFQVIENSIGLDQISFENVTTAGFESAVIEVFLDSNRNISYKTVAEYSNTLAGISSDFLFSIVNMEDEYENKTYDYEISLIDLLDSTQGFKFIFDGIEYLIKRDSGSYELEAYTSDTKKISFYFPDISALITLMPINSSVFTNKTINPTQNFILGKFRFDKYRNLASKYTASFESMGGLMVGHISDLDISEKFKKDNIDLATKELRSNGCVLGAKVTGENDNVGNYSFTVESGIVYIKGKRFKIPKQEIDTNLALATNTKIFIALDQKGNVVYDGAGSSACACPFDTENYLILATIEYDGSSLFNYDLRLFINSLDEKVLNHITVSPQDGMGHFSDIGSALKYAKRFSEVYNNAGIPKIILKSGTFRQTIEHSTSSALFLNQASLTKIATDGILIDFPVIIEGEGESTVLDLTNLWSDTLASDKATELKNRGGIYVLGNSIQPSDLPVHPNASALSGNVTIKNLKLKNSRIYVIDQYNEYTGIVQKNKVNLENVTFESDTTFDQGALYIHYNAATFDFSNLIGNISITSSIFEESASRVSSLTNSQFVKNFSFLNNIFDSSLSAATDSALSLPDDAALSLFDLTTEQTFFEFFGNIHEGLDLVRNVAASLTSGNFNKSGRLSGYESFFQINSKFIIAEDVTITGNLNHTGSSASSFTDITTTNLVAGTADINNFTVEDIEITGSLTGNVISSRYLSFSGANTDDYFLASIDGGSAGSSTLASLFTSYANNKTIFATASSSTSLKNLVLKNHSSDVINGNVIIYRIGTGIDPADFASHTLIGSYSTVLGSFSTGGITIPSGMVEVASSATQSYAIVFEVISPVTLTGQLMLSAEAIFVKEVT